MYLRTRNRHWPSLERMRGGQAPAEVVPVTGGSIPPTGVRDKPALLCAHRIRVHISCGGGEGRVERAGGGCGKGNVGIFGGGVNENGFGFAPALSGLLNEAPRAWPNARGG
jgi:hypothetical protein